MSEAHQFEVHSEDDHLPCRVIAIVFAITCALAIGWVGVAWWVLGSSESHARPSGEFSERDLRPPPVIEGIESTLITVDNPGAVVAADQRAVLDSYGWVDRDRGVVRIPIERAMEIVSGAHR
jgi:hypothetical protein